MNKAYNKLYQSLFIASSTSVALFSPVILMAAEETDERIEKIAVVGTRAAPRSVTDSAVPLDIIDSKELLRQGNTDLKSLLSTVTPSFNVNDQPISDAGTMVRPANLRGLSSDHTLVLVNGKRRHRSAVITFLGGGLSDGSQGPDISNIPVSALKQVEVLRDGAAAQYGSDAIAGVLNFVLKDSAEGGMMEARYGRYYQGDGPTFQIAGNIGLPLSENGFANFSMEYRAADDTSRSAQRDDAQTLINAGNTYVADPAQIWGSPEIKYDFKTLGNFGLDLNDTDEAYMWINFAKREVEGGFYFRNPHTRSGVFDGGNGNLLVGDLTPNDNLSCPVVPTGSNVLNSPAFQQIVNDPNCFAFNEIARLRGGFTPRFGGVVTDFSMVLGTNGEIFDEWLYDISGSFGYSNVDFSIKNTINPSLGPNTPFEFSPGEYTQVEQTYNFDVSKAFDISDWEEPIYFAAGVEFRHESFEITSGDPASFANGPLASQGFSVGSNGFPGFKPEDAGTNSRNNYAAYIDVENYLSENWLLTAAVRYEDFSDFGQKTTGKVSTHVSIGEVWGVRAAVSSGFRAPTVGQSNVRNVTTAFTANGLQDQATLPPTHPISLQKGGKELEPETSINISGGVVAEFESGVFMTLDYFNIKLKDRLSQTSPLLLTDADKKKLIELGITEANNFSSVKYFTNDFDTTTQGIDLVMNYSTEILGGDADFALAYNWTDTVVDSHSSNINAGKVRMLEENIPQHRGNITTSYRYGDIDVFGRLNYYDDFFEDHLDSNLKQPISSGKKVTFDLEVTYHIDEYFSASVGAQNLFDTRPDENPFKGVAGALYPPTSPIGINGGLYYLMANYTF